MTPSTAGTDYPLTGSRGLLPHVPGKHSMDAVSPAVTSVIVWRLKVKDVCDVNNESQQAPHE